MRPNDRIAPEIRNVPRPEHAVEERLSSPIETSKSDNNCHPLLPPLRRRPLRYHAIQLPEGNIAARDKIAADNGGRRLRDRQFVQLSKIEKSARYRNAKSRHPTFLQVKKVVFDSPANDVLFRLGNLETLLLLANTCGYFAMCYVLLEFDGTSAVSELTSYAVPYLVLTDARIIFTRINALIAKKILDLQNMLKCLQPSKSNELHVAHVLKGISAFHFHICKAAAELNESLKVQVVLVFARAFQDVLITFYVLTKHGGNFPTLHYVFWGVSAVFELLLITFPASKIRNMVIGIDVRFRS